MSKKTVYDKIVDWFDVRFGFAKTPLRPVPLFTLNPIYWLGFLLAVTFAMQVATGMFMLLYYVPSPDQAYSSTIFVINSVPLGHLVETLHLYTAYAMILLTFMHLTRNYFGSSHKENRDLMWVAGIIMLLIVLTFGVTGYLLPWTVLSKSATDVAIGFTNFLPKGLSDLAKFLMAGSGSDVSELRRFVTLHTVVLPWTLALFLALKIYMYEVHGPSYVPAYGKTKVPGGKLVGWFPRVFVFGVMLVSAYIAILFAVSALFPLVLPPEFNPATASNYVVQPDWYLLWIYQTLKIEAFEGGDAAIALGAIGIFLVLLLLLPFYDRSSRRDLSVRPLFVTVGVLMVAEYVALTIWGYLTPGQVIPNYQAVLVIGGVAVAAVVVTRIIYRIYRARTASSQASSEVKSNTLTRLSRAKLGRLMSALGHDLYSRFTAVFVLLLVISSVTLASLVNMLSGLLMNLPVFIFTSVVFVFSTYTMCWMLRKLVVTYEKQASVRVR